MSSTATHPPVNGKECSGAEADGRRAVESPVVILTGGLASDFTICIYVPVKRRELLSAPLPPHPNRGPRRFGLLPKLQRFRAFHVQAGSQMEKTYSFSFPESRIFLATPFHYCRLKGDLLRIVVECEYVFVQ